MTDPAAAERELADLQYQVLVAKMRSEYAQNVFWAGLFTIIFSPLILFKGSETQVQRLAICAEEAPEARRFI